VAGIDYTELYQLQDEVLKTLFENEREFYLTGGTCISRFYKAKRYSDDLDFFTNASSRYNFAVKNIKTSFDKNFELTIEVETKNFTRFRIGKILQVDFVNDISSRYKDIIITDNDVIIDNIENILSNKITAIIGRDDPKDVFDFYLICYYYSFHWNEIMNSAHDKAGFVNEDLIVRLKSFPIALFDDIKCIDCSFLDNFAHDLPIIIDEILGEGEHAAIHG